MQFRLADVVDSISPILETKERTDDHDHNEMPEYNDYYDENEEIRNYHYKLGRAKFAAVNLVKGGRHVTVELGQEPELDKYYLAELRMLGQEHELGQEMDNKLSFEVQTYLNDVVVFGQKKLYISELEKDDTT